MVSQEVLGLSTALQSPGLLPFRTVDGQDVTRTVLLPEKMHDDCRDREAMDSALG